jgi:hypothetical protein
VDHSYLLRNPATTELQFRFPRALHLDVWVVSLEKLTVDDPLIQSGYNTRIDDLDAMLSLSQGPANPDDLSEMFGKRKWELIVLGTLNFVSRPRIFFMVVEHHADSAARVGVMTIYCRTLELFGQYVNMKRRRVRLM